ncbi:HSF-type DNA-binding-domain-containing protein [Venturia nashicola]|nr:HSF-type DNA-binding-domain-containing protein [Venturia nashicola]
MATTTESVHRSPFDTASDHYAPNRHKSIPILPSSSASPHMSSTEPMDVAPAAPTATMGPPLLSSPVAERQTSNGSSEPTITINGSSATAVGAAAAAQQPKVVQTAFIHKLYNMLEDTSIAHLIAWSISDVFHTGQPDAPLWEFRHGNGNFKRGDLTGLREIKRRASRHTLINRDSFPNANLPKPAVPQIGPPVEAMPPDPLEARIHAMEQNYHYFDARLARSEDTSSFLNSKCTFLSEGLVKCHQWNQELATHLLQMMPDQDTQIHKEISLMRGEINRQMEMLRSFEDAPEPLSSGSGGSRQHYFSNLQDNGHPLSPRQMPVNDQRRPSQPTLMMESRPSFRPPHATHLSISPRRYGSIGSGHNYSPSSARPIGHPPSLPAPPPMQHPLATVSSPPMNLSRRHTSADIRQHGWPPGQQGANHSPYASGHNSTQWPSSPHRGPIDRIDENHELRNSLASYRLSGNDSSQHGSRQPTPPPHMATDLSSQRDDLPQGQWALPGPKFNLGSFRTQDTSAPATRRSSMASNVHNLLNPAGAGDEDEQDPDGRNKRRKRE